jgi:metal-dependent amidase/aminoacylase/carboxypeptidase family protein
VEEILVRIGRLAESLASAYGARVRLTRIDEPYDEMRTNPVLADLFKRNLADLGVETVDTPRERMGSLDMGNVSCAVPALHAYVGIVPETGALHTREFAQATVSRKGERGLLLAVQALAMTAIDLMTDPEHLAAARRLFEAERIRGKA